MNLEAITWGGLTWMNIDTPTERETGYLAERYGFHRLHSFIDFAPVKF